MVVLDPKLLTILIMTRSAKLLLSLVTAFASIGVYAQVLNLPKEHKNVPVEQFVSNDRTMAPMPQSPVANPDSAKRYLIEFTELPLYATNSEPNFKSASLSNMQLQRIEDQHKRFASDLVRLQGAASMASKSFQTSSGATNRTIEFRNVFNGVAMTAEDDLIGEIEKLSYVKAVHVDRQVRGLDHGSNNSIHATNLWADYGVTGKGVVIAIMDTGIDTTHQDLSNGKVIGGYDFVNNDADPMDDHGHGTHCAGIAAANGSGLKGVAPDAKLLSVKVLDEWNIGYDSWILSGLEYAIDPDGDPSTADGADIINMSFGTDFGLPNDPLSVAVDLAFQKGVLCVVAAGDQGDKNLTISSPGCSKEALTVGSGDTYGSLNFSSSKGPALNSYEIKPNILAPGWDIYSAGLNNTYENRSGTSMATSHIAGAAALMKELHKDWTAKDLRSALVHTAVEKGKGYNVWEQGNGYLDLLETVKVGSTISKNSLNFGLVSLSDQTIDRTDSFYVYNRSSRSLDYTLSVNGELPAELQVALSINKFTLAPADSQLVCLTLKADNSSLAFPTGVVPSYVGNILVDDGVKPLQLFFSMIKGYSFEIELDFVPRQIVVHNGSDMSFKNELENNRLVILVPAGIYDIIVAGDNRFIVRENIDVSKINHVTISKNEAKHRVEFKGYNPVGKPLSLLDVGSELLVLKDKTSVPFGCALSNGNTNVPMLIPPIVRYFSEISDKYRYEIRPTSYPSMNEERQWYTIPFMIDQTIKRDTVIYNDPNKFVKLNYKIANFPGEVDSIYFTNTSVTQNVHRDYYSFDQRDAKYHELTRPYMLSKYIYPSPNKQYWNRGTFGLTLYAKNGTMNPASDLMLLQSEGSACWIENGKTYFAKVFRHDQTEVQNNVDMDLNIAPLTVSPIYFHEQTKDCKISKEFPYFRDMNNAYIVQKVPFQVFSNSNLIFQDTIWNRSPSDWSQFSIPIAYDTEYRFDFKDVSYSVHKMKGELDATFYKKIVSNQSTFTGIYPPSTFEIQADGKLSNVLDAARNNRFFIMDESLDDVDLYIKRASDSIWSSIYSYQRPTGVWPVNCNIPLPDSLQKGYYSVKLITKSGASDSSIFVYEPAFYVMSGLEKDSLALVDLYRTTGGENWKNNSNWLKTEIKDWVGVTLKNERVAELHLPNNHIQGRLPNSFIHLTELQKVNLSGNDITGLVNLNSFQKLIDADFTNNKLRFDDIIPYASLAGFKYNPQQKINESATMKLEVGDRLVIQSFVTDSNSLFAWYHNEVLVPNAQSNMLFVDSVSFDHSGVYKLRITHSALPGFALETNPIYVDVNGRQFDDRSLMLVGNQGRFMGGSWIDYDNDGDQDLFVVNEGESNQLFRNNLIETGQVSFTDVTYEAMRYDKGASFSATWADYNNDGLTDVFISNRSIFERSKLFVNKGNGIFHSIQIHEVDSLARKARTANWVDVDRDGYVDLMFGTEQDHRLEKSLGFMLMNKAGQTLEAGLGTQFEILMNHATWFDSDNDGDQDVFISQYGRDYFWENNDQKFSTSNPNPTEFYSQWQGQTSSVGDFDNDGLLDVFLGRTSDGVQPVDNLLLKNNGGTFSLFEDNALMADGTGYKSSGWADFDNDGDLDLVTIGLNGQTNLWLNMLQESGSVSFRKTDFGRMAEVYLGGNSCSFGDFDNDGDLDLFLTYSEYGFKLLENVIGDKNNWINIKCKGVQSNASAIGTRVKIKATINNKPCWQTREITSLTGASSQSSLNVSFGLGDATRIDSLQVFWPSGIQWDTTGVQINQFIELVEHEKIIKPAYLVAFNDTVILEDVAFSKQYAINEPIAGGISTQVVRKPYWVQTQLNNTALSVSGTPDDYAPGKHYLVVSFSGGTLKSPVLDSICIEVINVNDAPQIKGQQNAKMAKEGFYVIQLANLIVEDVDNSYPTDFTLSVLEGTGYSLSGDTVFNSSVEPGVLKVPVKVNDGQLFSNVFDFSIEVLTGVDSYVEQTIRAYPIPFTDKLQVEVSLSLQIENIGIYDLLGKRIEVPMQEMATNRFEFNCSNLNESVYFLKIKSANTIHLKKLIKTN